jgi:RNA 3'-terminal phosphate cyclase (ATP)
MTSTLQIDGSQGEGGGQVLRTALALSAVTGRPFRMVNIRGRRPQPGLRPQHLECVRGVARICEATVRGDQEGSQELIFDPGVIRPGEYRFDIRTAGSTGLLLQAVYLPLALAGGPSRLTLVGGTHVPWSPSFHYLDWQWTPHLALLGLRVKPFLARCGFYPRGGGEVRVSIEPWDAPAALDRVDRGALICVRGVSAAPNLAESIALRQRKAVLERLAPKRYGTEVEVIEAPAYGAGTFVALLARYERGAACVVELGEPRRRAEHVGATAAKRVVEFDRSAGAVDEYLADQLLLPLSLTPGESRLSTSRITGHLLTNAHVIRLFLDARIEVQGDPEQEGVVRVTGASPRPGAP